MYYINRTKYEARTSYELPVLIRYFPKELVSLTKAKFLDIILYSKEQIVKETEAIKGTVNKEEYDYGIISIKPQDEDFEVPMNPITMMRNALGTEEGGSGVSLNKEKYMQSVAYWDMHAMIK